MEGSRRESRKGREGLPPHGGVRVCMGMPRRALNAGVRSTRRAWEGVSNGRVWGAGEECFSFFAEEALEFFFSINVVAS